jgi:hypothetical protein
MTNGERTMFYRLVRRSSVKSGYWERPPTSKATFDMPCESTYLFYFYSIRYDDLICWVCSNRLERP